MTPIEYAAWQFLTMLYYDDDYQNDLNANDILDHCCNEHTLHDVQHHAITMLVAVWQQLKIKNIELYREIENHLSIDITLPSDPESNEANRLLIDELISETYDLL